MKKTLNGLKKYLKTTILGSVKFGKLQGSKLFATLKSGKKIYWLINEDFSLKSWWYYTI